ncbi:transporter [Aureimonas sp. Leaf454]|uniref:AEC family transporter n=1 Tax=Aureimonas sp. Leaf454 TaxID=1736381 RepID=UPI0006F5D2E0|nr:AEC family transporter [Aureimonas sp. Leaf454]KQT47576.1 transporter [Aureimonas sp. Leaf454]
MLSTLAVVLPVFALVFAGWLARRLGFLGPHATSELNRFVVYLALPTLLFDIVAHAGWSDLWQPGFIAAFGLSGLLVFSGTVAVRRRSRPLADAAIDGLNAGYANTGFVGFPLALAALGPAAMAPTLLATILTVCVLFGIALVLIEIGVNDAVRGPRLVGAVAGSLARNPLVIAPALGLLVPLLGLSVPASLDGFLKLLGAAASPTALVALGSFLAAERAAATRDAGSATLIVALKLLVQPLIAWTLAVLVFDLTPMLTHTAVLMAALPTGTGPFMLAELHRRDGHLTATVVLVSTLLSILTVSAYLAVAI